MSNKKKRKFDLTERYNIPIKDEPSIDDYIRGIQKDEMWTDAQLGYADALFQSAQNVALSQNTRIFLTLHGQSDHTAEEFIKMGYNKLKETPHKYRLDLEKAFDGGEYMVLTEIRLRDENSDSFDKRSVDSYLMIWASYIPYPYTWIVRMDARNFIGGFRQFKEEVLQWMTETEGFTVEEFKTSYDYGFCLSGRL